MTNGFCHCLCWHLRWIIAIKNCCSFLKNIVIQSTSKCKILYVSLQLLKGPKIYQRLKLALNLLKALQAILSSSLSSWETQLMTAAMKKRTQQKTQAYLVTPPVCTTKSTPNIMLFWKKGWKKARMLILYSFGKPTLHAMMQSSLVQNVF